MKLQNLGAHNNVIHHDDLRPARGIIIGIVLSIPFWVLVWVALP